MREIQKEDTIWIKTIMYQLIEITYNGINQDATINQSDLGSTQ